MVVNGGDSQSLANLSSSPVSNLLCKNNSWNCNFFLARYFVAWRAYDWTRQFQRLQSDRYAFQTLPEKYRCHSNHPSTKVCGGQITINFNQLFFQTVPNTGQSCSASSMWSPLCQRETLSTMVNVTSSYPTSPILDTRALNFRTPSTITVSCHGYQAVAMVTNMKRFSWRSQCWQIL